MAQENIQVARRVLPESGQPVPGWLIILTLDILKKTSLISQYAFGWCGPMTSSIALRHALSKSCALCTVHEISRTSCSTNPLSSSH